MALAAACLAAAPAAGASVPTILQDDGVILHSTDDGVRQAMQELRSLGIDYVRVTAGWSVIAPQPDSATPPAGFDGSDPADYPQQNWGLLDRAVNDATAAGLKVDIDIAFWAPRWATQDPASSTMALRTNINPQLYAQFAQAVARRYSGSYVVPTPPPPSSSTSSSTSTQSQSSCSSQSTPQPQPSPDETLLSSLLGYNQQPQQQQQQQCQPPPAKPASTPPAPSPPLPAAAMFTIWNEPNEASFLLPQWTQVNGDWEASSADIYRAMVQAAYPVIKSTAPNATVLVGGTSSNGSSLPGARGVPPLQFLRQLACVDSKLRPISTGSCADFKPIPGDGWAHHPYSLDTLPDYLPHNSDKAPVSATFRLTALLRTLAKMGRISRADQGVYMTEYGYATNPPETDAPFGLAAQARNLAWAEFIATRDPAVKMWPQFLLRDSPNIDPSPLGDAWHTGLYFNDGTPKPAAATFRVPAFATCVTSKGKQWTLLWGELRNPSAGASAQVDVRFGGAWSGVATAASMRPDAALAASATPPGGVMTRYVPWQHGAIYRLIWNDPGSGSMTTIPVRPVGCTEIVAKAARDKANAAPHKSKAGRHQTKARAHRGKARHHKAKIAPHKR
jgi:hypothetical protein